MSGAGLDGDQRVALEVLDHLLEGCQVIGPDYRYVYVNGAAARHGRTSPERLLGRTMAECYPGIEATPMFAVLRTAMVERTHRELENEFTFPDGAKGWFQLQFDPVPDGVAILSIDVTRRKQGEAALRRAHRALAVLSECNQTLVRSTDEGQFMADACRLAVERGGYRLAWLGLKQDDAESSVLPVARAGLDDGYVDSAQVTWADTERGAGPMGRAIRTGRPVIARFIASDPAFAPWREGALARGYASAISLPVRVAERVVGALNIYAGDPDAFDDEERTLLEEMALDVGYGITALRARAARERAEARVAHLNAVLRGIRGVHQLIARERDSQTLVRKACELLVESRGFDTCFAFVADGDRVEIVAGAGTEGKLQVLRRMLAQGQWPECMRAALRQDGVVVRRSDAEACRGCPVEREYARQRHAVAVRLRSQDRTFGALLVSLPRGMDGDEEELALIRETAGDLAFALSGIEVALENVRVLQDLEDGKRRTRAVYEHLPGAVLLWGRRGGEFVLEDFNEAARSLGNGAIPASLGRPPQSLEHCLAGLREGLETCFARRTVLRREVECSLPGVPRPLRLVMTFGNVPTDTVLLHVEDVTERRLTEEQLQLSQRLEAIGRLAGGVAHDFNNLLSVIITYAGFAIDQLGPEAPVRADLEEVRKAGERAATLTKQLLAFSRRQVLEPKALSLGAVVAGIEGLLRRLLGEDVEVVALTAGDLGTVLADPGQIEQVLVNLAVNARDAMPAGGKLTIETSNAELDEAYAKAHVAVKPGRYVMLSVTDTGHGMDAAVRERIFEPFFTTKEKGKGTGLGLSTVYGIVKQSGGNIWVYSEPGHGTAFKIYLPRVDVPVTEETIPAPPASVVGHETVLLVEDEDAVRRLAERILRSVGYQILSAATGDEALRLCEKHEGEIALLLTDVVMPQMSGRELAERLAKLRPGLRVLYMSGYTDNAIVHHGVLNAGTRFISKPFTAPDLARRVREALDGP